MRSTDSGSIHLPHRAVISEGSSGSCLICRTLRLHPPCMHKIVFEIIFLLRDCSESCAFSIWNSVPDSKLISSTSEVLKVPKVIEAKFANENQSHCFRPTSFRDSDETDVKMETDPSAHRVLEREDQISGISEFWDWTQIFEYSDLEKMKPISECVMTHKYHKSQQLHFWSHSTLNPS